MHPIFNMFIMYTCIYVCIFAHYSTQKVIDKYFLVYKWCVCAHRCVEKQR